MVGPLLTSGSTRVLESFVPAPVEIQCVVMLQKYARQRNCRAMKARGEPRAEIRPVGFARSWAMIGSLLDDRRTCARPRSGTRVPGGPAVRCPRPPVRARLR